MYAKTSIAISAILAVGFFLLPLAASAAVLYVQTTDNSGSIGFTPIIFPCGGGGNTGVLLGTFTTDASAHTTGGGIVDVFLNNPGGSTDNIDINISSSSSYCNQVDFAAAAFSVPAHTTVYQEATSSLGSANLMPSTTYYVMGTDGNGTGNTQSFSGGTQIYGFITDSGGGSPPLANTNTRIISVVPAGGSTVATSTSGTIGATVYVSPADYQNGDYVSVILQRNSNVQQPFLAAFRFPIASNGQYTYSTTTDLSAIGDYTVRTQVRTPQGIGALFDTLFSFFTDTTAQNLTLVSTTTGFTVSTPTAYDSIQRNIKSGIIGFVASSTVDLGSCNAFSGFNLGTCLNLLLVPSQADVSDAFQGFVNGFLSYAPWGYVTRFGVILAGQSTSSLPVLSLTFPLGAPGTSGYFVDTYTLDPNDMLAGGDAMLNSAPATFGPGTGMTFQQITEPLLIDLLAVLLIIGMIMDMARMRGRSHHGGGGKLS